MSLAELQLQLLNQTLNNKLEVEPFTIEDVVMIYLKQIVENGLQGNSYGEQLFKQAITESQSLNQQIQSMIKFESEIQPNFD